MAERDPLPHGSFVSLPNGVRVHYHDAGSGLPVVFLHGSGPGASSWSNFKGNEPVIREAGYRTILPDLVGFGFSDKPTDRPYHINFFVECLLGLLDALEIEECVLVGNSLGGGIALRTTLDAPDRVKKLVLMAPGGIEEKEAYFKMEGIVRMMELFSSGGLDPDTMRELLSLQLYDESLVTDALVAERLAVVPLQPKEVLSTMEVPNMDGELDKIRCPVLGFWGTNDRFCPSSGAQKIIDACPDARMMLLNRCGHWVMVERQALFNRLCVEFLDGRLD